VLGTALAGTAFLLVPRVRTERTPLADEAVPVTRRDIGRVVKATGVIKPAIGAEVRVGSRVSGVVRRLRVRVGDTVRAGDPLAELDARELIARRNDAEATVKLAEANRAYAHSEFDRKRRLADERLIAAADLDLARRGADVADQQLAQARATLELADTQVSYAEIAAPMTGVVSSVSTQEGETVAASFAAPTFLTLLDLDRLEVRAYVDETDIGRVQRGQAATFTVDTYTGQQFSGRIDTIYPQAEIRDNVVNYVAVIRFRAPPGHRLRPEMTTAVTIPLDVRRQVLAVPIKAVRSNEHGPYLVVRRPTGPQRQLVRLGMRDDQFFEVVDGVSEGDLVIIDSQGDHD
jgi:RND family efflux transporter MFP subunit